MGFLKWWWKKLSLIFKSFLIGSLISIILLSTGVVTLDMFFNALLIGLVTIVAGFIVVFIVADIYTRIRDRYQEYKKERMQEEAEIIRRLKEGA